MDTPEDIRNRGDQNRDCEQGHKGNRDKVEPYRLENPTDGT